jgi:hypothetical protein
VVNNNFPVTPEMYRKGEFELALLKGMEVRLHPLMAGAHAELEQTMFKWRAPELVGRKAVKGNAQHSGAFVTQSKIMQVI